MESQQNYEMGLVVAAWRWNVISPLVATGVSHEERRRNRRLILEREHEDPIRGPRRISASALRRWTKAYQRDGIRGLYPKPRIDKGSLKAFPEEVLTRAIELRKEAPRRQVKKLVELLKGEFPAEASHITRPTLDRHLRARGWSRAALRNTAAPFISFEAPYRNALWMGDVLHGPEVISDEGEILRVKVFGWIDDHTRLPVHLEGYEDERLPALENALEKAIRQYGLPERIFVDNAFIFSSTYLSLICATLGIEKVHSTPGYAPSRGKIERFFRTVREELFCEIEALPPMPLGEFNRLLRAWVETIYNRRIHSRTGQSPLDRWESSLVPLRTLIPSQVREAFLLWARRKVGATGEIKFNGNIYYADPTLAHKTVIIRYDPWDLRELFLHSNGSSMQRLTVDRLIIRQIRRPEKPEKQRVSKSARRYLEHLQQTYQQQLASEMRLIRFSDYSHNEEDDVNGYAS